MMKIPYVKTCFMVLGLILSLIKSSNGQAVPIYVPTSGLVAWYPFTGNANDSSGHGYNGIDSGASLTSDRFGNANSAYYFNGVNSNILLSSTISSGPSTVSIWVNVDSIITWVCGSYVLGEEFFSTLSNVACCSGYEMVLNWNDPSYKSRVVLNNDTGVFDTFNLHTWVHICQTYQTDTYTVYINGNLVNSSFCSRPLNSNPIRLGARYQATCVGTTGVFPYYFFNGKLDDIGIWNRILTPCEISDLYRSNDSCSSLAINTIPLDLPNKITSLPNPAASDLTIISTQSITQIAITNLFGQVVYFTTSGSLLNAGGGYHVDISQFYRGMYFVIVNGTEVSKFIKQ